MHLLEKSLEVSFAEPEDTLGFFFIAGEKCGRGIQGRERFLAHLYLEGARLECELRFRMGEKPRRYLIVKCPRMFADRRKIDPFRRYEPLGNNIGIRLVTDEDGALGFVG